MQHSVKWIAKNYSEISSKRKDKKLFKFDDFISNAIAYNTWKSLKYLVNKIENNQRHE